MQRHPPKDQEASQEPLFVTENGVESNSHSRKRIKNSMTLEVGNSASDTCVFSVDEGEEKGGGPTLTMLESLMFISLGGGGNSLMSLNDNLPNVLRCCILLELALKRRIGLITNTDSTTDFLKQPVEVVKERCAVPVGDQFQDEALALLRQFPSGSFSLQKWIDILTGEVLWDRQLSASQMLQVRERLCKSLVEKRLVGTEVHRSLWMLEQVRYPIKDIQSHRSLCYRLIDTATGKIPMQPTDLLLLLAVKAAGLIPAICKVTDAPTSSAVKHSCKALQQRFQSPQEINRLFHLPPSQLYLVTGIIRYFSKTENLLF